METKNWREGAHTRAATKKKTETIDMNKTSQRAKKRREAGMGTASESETETDNYGGKGWKERK